jgi:hypothetical protein
MSKSSLCMWISAYPFVQSDFFLKIPHVWEIWDFVDMYLTNLGTRIWSPSIHIYTKKWFFWPSKLCCIYWAEGEKLFSPTLNLMILQTVWNECVKFGGYVNIQVSYKILWLEVPKKASILHNPTCFQEGFVLRQLWTQHGHWCLGFNVYKRNIYRDPTVP